MKEYIAIISGQRIDVIAPNIAEAASTAIKGFYGGGIIIEELITITIIKK